MKKIALSLLLLALTFPVLAAGGDTVSYKSGADTVQGVLFTPSGDGPFPAVIVIHEWWGLNDWIREQASRLADQGYVALAVDLYRGRVATTAEEAHELMRGVPEDRAALDLRAAFGYLKSLKNVKSARIGAIGWCMGGGYALNLAVLEPSLAADVINYGHLAAERDTLKKINAPVLGLFGGQDRGIPPDDVRKFEAAMKQLGKKADMVIYPDAGHAFQNPNNKGGYRPDDAADAWKRTVAFLDKTLKK